MFFKKVIEIIQKIEFPLFLITILLFRIPPFFLIPLARNPLLSSHSLGRYLIIWLFFINFISLFLAYKKLVIPKKFKILILFFFVTQSISIMSSVNTEAFLLQYKNLVFGLLIFITALMIINSKRKLFLTLHMLLITIIINVVFQAIIYFQPQLLINVLQQFLYETYWEVLILNLQRKRFFVDIYDATLISIIFIAFINTNKLNRKIFFVLLIGLVTFFAFVSNFRTQLLMAIFSLFSIYIFLLNKSAKKIIYIFIFLLVFYFGYQVSLKVVGYNAIDRLLLNEAEDVQTITGRFQYWQESVRMANNSPFFGVGIGNYYDNLSTKTILTTSLFNWKNTLSRITATHPHSVFFGILAETGYLGLVSYLVLLLYFLITDIKYLLQKKEPSIAFIIAFWGLFIYAAFNPPVTLSYFLLFWLLRVFIIKSNLFV